ncbi:E3 ubiquitin-protein ligase EL5-like [Phragmites australis]|uniref:E3 ubiquitin-protein ligase EL5-like n=1 Tax=Phragmites australis TaxID=29695 RepID=UPI002D76E42C|nr:E3 ubiquitin-protein ligase EL5-like [Phragmites australis]
MAVTATTVAAATTMLAAVATIFLTFVLCFYIFLCAKQYRGGAPAGQGVAALLRFMFGGGGGGGGRGEDGAAAWCYEGGLDEKTMAKLPRREVGKGEALDCAVCITVLVAGETARVLPRCGHAFHVDCIDMWLRSHSTCPLCRCPAVDEPPVPPVPSPVPTPEADPESPNFPTNVLFFGSQDEVSTGRAQQQSPAMATPLSAPPPSQGHVAAVVEEARAPGLRRLLGCGGASPPPQPLHHHHHHYQDADRDIEMGLAAGESSASRPVKPPQPGS